MSSRKNIKSVARICLQKPLKVGPRRCTYRRWEAEIKGKTLITKTTELERMYRGNTPYPVCQPKLAKQTYATCLLAHLALRRATIKRKALSYRTV